ncbi:MAG: GNAT family N-acetyltransferase [Eudoraea sp.]|nr:GNAT family N-acetyltransferase [Eudoraea sp.]
MIQKIDHKSALVAKPLYELFQASYAVEAKLLGATDFPPLKRKMENFMESSNAFYGYFKENSLAAVAEIDSGPDSTHIHSLVVHPKFFRQGIGGALVTFVLEQYDAKVFTVETGLKNEPATQLYLKLGFREVYQYDTDHGVRKVRFEKKVLGD